ncbi:MAG TPA: hypothetical protein VGG11_13790 [Xanthobacteraceae bacterium]|jgi:hypothetical protein
MPGLDLSQFKTSQPTASTDTGAAPSSSAPLDLSQFKTAPSQPTPSPFNVYGTAMSDKANGTGGNFGLGLAKGAAATVKTLGTFGQWLANQTVGRVANAAAGKGFTPTSGSLFPTAATSGQNDIYTPGTQAATAADQRLAPQGAQQNIGYGAEKLGELLMPTGIEEGATDLGTQVAAKLAPKLASKAAAVASKAIPFVARSAAAGIDQGGKTALGGGSQGQSVGMGIAGALTPSLGAALKGVKDALPSTASGIINSIVKPLKNSFAYGHDPARGILNEGITANSLDDLQTKIGTARQSVGKQISTLAQTVTQSGRTSDFAPALAPIDDAMQAAAKNNNPTLLQSLSNVKTALTHDLTLGEGDDGSAVIKKGAARDLGTMTYQQGQQLLDDITAHTRFTGNPSDDKAINQATQGAYRNVRTVLNGMAADTDSKLGAQIKDLNQRYGDLSAAQTAVNHRVTTIARQNFLSLTDKLGFAASVGSSLTYAMVTGDMSKAGELLVGELGVGGLAKLAGSTAAKTRVAQFLNKVGTTQRAALLANNPVLRTLYQRLSGNFTQPSK